MTDVQELVAKVEASDVFEQGSLYLCHVFTNVKDGNHDMEVGYYDRKTDKITVFVGDPVVARPPEDVYKDGGAVQELKISDVSIGFAEAQQIAEDFRTAKYNAHPVMQAICVLQQLDEPVWNITLVLATLNMLNIRIHAGSGDIISTDLRNIMDLRQKEDG
ncbi:MAG: hypothetical protein OXR66_09515 [Candidatus Woesearchaeota archaeon]|nr:hypothetical protein [Candidatus Woesearchaeota archaeon]